MRLFLDTNVLIDFMGERPSYYQQAASLFTLCAERRCDIVVSSLSMVTANFICCERGNIALSVWNRKATLMKEIIEVSSVDSDDIFSSCDSNWDDYEDCVQFQVAKESGCDVIVTRNIRDFFLSDIPVLSPDEAIDIIDNNHSI